MVLALSSLAILTPLLPTIVRRPVFDSLDERTNQLYSTWESGTAMNLIFGRGIGTGTNTAITGENLRGEHLKSSAANDNAMWEPSDSTVTLLLRQIGILGTALFYLVLLYAAWGRNDTRLFFVIVFLTSLTINVTELFPVNILLGLGLAHRASAL